jgi:hypothetical protein
LRAVCLAGSPAGERQEALTPNRRVEDRMFIGHFGAGFAAKPTTRKTSLGTLFLASQFIDLLWPVLLLLGLEAVEIAPGATRLVPLEFTHYPISHSLLAVGVWSVLFSAACYAVLRAVGPALVCGALVASHWFLDAITHIPDLLLFPGGDAKVGLGLWNRPALAVVLEVTVFAVGVFLYARSTRATSRVGAIALWALVAFLLVVHSVNIFGPAPPSVDAIAWTSQSQWLVVAWGFWVDRHREVRSS